MTSVAELSDGAAQCVACPHTKRSHAYKGDGCYYCPCPHFSTPIILTAEERDALKATIKFRLSTLQGIEAKQTRADIVQSARTQIDALVSAAEKLGL